MTTTLAKLIEAWEEAQAGIGRVVWLRSQVGTGKSAMLRSFFQAVDEMPQESAVVFCRCGDASIVSTSDHGELEALIAQIAEGFRAFGASEETQDHQKDIYWLFAKSRLSQHKYSIVRCD